MKKIMKKITLIFLATFIVTKSYSQILWTPTNGSTTSDIFHTGNVGIGISSGSLAAKLHISTAGTMGLFINHQSTSPYSYAQLIKVQNDQTKALFISRVSGASETSIFQIWGNGTVNAKAIYAESITVTQNSMISWPDYVFKKEYKLLSIEELESYIKLNQHLPGVPSALTIKEKGMNVLEINQSLLEKVEELSLYIINMNKEIAEIKKQLEKK